MRRATLMAAAKTPKRVWRSIFPCVNRKILALFVAILLVSTCGEKSPQAVSATRPHADLERLQVQRQVIPTEITFDGRVEAVNQATVAAQTAGRIIDLPFDVGDFVEKDAVILRLTDTEQKARVDVANAQQQEAKTRLEEAEKNFSRAQELLQKKLIAKADFDRTSTEFNSAKARLESSTATLAEAEQNLSYTTLVAPYSGILLTRHVRIGESVAPGTPLLTGLSLVQLRVSVDIPQHHIGPLRKYRAARVQLPDGEWINASTLRIPPAADSASQTFKVLVELPELAQELFPGTLVKIGFASGEEHHLVIPVSALVKRGELTAVYVASPQGAVQLRYVRLGTATSANRVPVLAGLKEGEWLASDPIAAAKVAKHAQGIATP